MTCNLDDKRWLENERNRNRSYRSFDRFESCKRNFIDGKELRALGDLDNYVSKKTKKQAQDIFVGKNPTVDL